MTRNIVLIILILCCAFCVKKEINYSKHILVFSATQGFRHSSINAGKLALLKIGTEKSWAVDTTEDASQFTPENLSRYQLVVFLNTTGNLLNDAQKAAFQNYIRSGGSFVGIHSAADTESEWAWYNKLVGAIFESHPEPQEATYKVINKNHHAVIFMTDSLRRFEEIYNFKAFDKTAVNVLITVDEKSYSGGNMPDFHPVAWYHKYDGGKSFYTAWGHFPEAFTEPLFLEHIKGALTWAVTK